MDKAWLEDACRYVQVLRFKKKQAQQEGILDLKEEIKSLYDKAAIASSIYLFIYLFNININLIYILIYIFI
jgi:hypothetical protein